MGEDVIIFLLLLVNTLLLLAEFILLRDYAILLRRHLIYFCSGCALGLFNAINAAIGSGQNLRKL